MDNSWYCNIIPVIQICVYTTIILTKEFGQFWIASSPNPHVLGLLEEATANPFFTVTSYKSHPFGIWFVWFGCITVGYNVSKLEQWLNAKEKCNTSYNTLPLCFCPCFPDVPLWPRRWLSRSLLPNPWQPCRAKSNEHSVKKAFRTSTLTLAYTRPPAALVPLILLLDHGQPPEAVRRDLDRASHSPGALPGVRWAAGRLRSLPEEEQPV